MPGRRYSLATSDTNTAGTTQLGILATAAVRPQIMDLVISSVAAVNDYSAEYFIQRITTAGTSTAATPGALDSGDPAATAVCGVNHTAEPTYTANTVLLRVAVNLRATFRWVAQPEEEFKAPATASNGFGLLANAVTTAFAASYTVIFAE